MNRKTLAYAAAILLWLLLAARGSDSDETARDLGAVFGSWVASLAIALLIRLAYVKLVRRRAGLSFWSPWIFVIAAAIGLLARVPDLAEEQDSRSQARPAAGNRESARIESKSSSL